MEQRNDPAWVKK